MTEQFQATKARLDSLLEQIRPLLPKLAAARHTYFTAPTPEHKEVLDRVQSNASALHEEFVRLTSELKLASGLPPEAFEMAGEDASSRPGDPAELLRENLATELVQPTDEAHRKRQAAIAAPKFYAGDPRPTTSGDVVEFVRLQLHRVHIGSGEHLSSAPNSLARSGAETPRQAISVLRDFAGDDLRATD